MFMWQFSVQHTVVNDGAYDMAAFVPNASTLMYALPNKPSSDWTPEDVLRCLPSQDLRFPDLGNMTFLDVQLNASVTGQGPYPETIFGRGVLQVCLPLSTETRSQFAAFCRRVTRFLWIRGTHPAPTRRSVLSGRAHRWREDSAPPVEGCLALPGSPSRGDSCP